MRTVLPLVCSNVIALIVFGGFSVLYLKEDLRWNNIISIFFFIGPVYFAFKTP